LSTHKLRRQKQELIIWALLVLSYGVACLILLFGFLYDVSRTPERLLATSGFVVGGLLALYAMLLSALSKVQEEPEKTKTRARLKVALGLLLFVCAIHLLALLLKYSEVIQ
jgi:4-hydroxybenzoate polyprenyltransferase